MLCDVQAAGDVHSRCVSLCVVRRRVPRRAVGVHVPTAASRRQGQTETDRENIRL